MAGDRNRPFARLRPYPLLLNPYRRRDVFDHPQVVAPHRQCLVPQPFGPGARNRLRHLSLLHRIARRLRWGRPLPATRADPDSIKAPGTTSRAASKGRTFFMGWSIPSFGGPGGVLA